MLEAQTDGFSLTIGIVPLNAWFNYFPIICSHQFNIPDGKIKTRAPRLNWYNFYVTARDKSVSNKVFQREGFWLIVIL